MIKDNQDRADRAQRCLDADSDDNDTHTQIVDLICNLRHLADTLDDAGDWEQITTMADYHYFAEIADQQDDEIFGRGC